MPIDQRSWISIQALRFVAAFMVVIHHSVNDLTIRSGIADGAALRDFFYFGASGVQIFFVISGFVMVWSSAGLFQKRGGWRHFLYRRLIRIYPIYAIGVLLNIFLRSLWDTISSPLQVLATLLLLPGFAGRIIVPAWTLSYEMYFYLLFATVLIFSMRTALVLLSGVFFLCISSASVLHHGLGNEWLIMAQSPLLLDFLAGAWLGWFMKVIPASRLAVVPPVLPGLILVLSCAALLGNFVLARHLPYMITFGGPAILIVASSILLERTERGLWLFRLLARLGDASYSLYLIHQLVLIVLVPLVAGFVTGSATFALAITGLSAIALVAGLGFYGAVEVPLLRLLRRRVIPQDRPNPDRVTSSNSAASQQKR